MDSLGEARKTELKAFLDARSLAELHQLKDLMTVNVPPPMRQRRASTAHLSAAPRRRRASIVDLLRKPKKVDIGASTGGELLVHFEDCSTAMVSRASITGNFDEDVDTIMRAIQEQKFAGQGRLHVNDARPYFALYPLDGEGRTTPSPASEAVHLTRDVAFLRRFYIPDDVAETAEFGATSTDDFPLNLGYHHAVSQLLSGKVPVLTRDNVRFAALQLLAMHGLVDHGDQVPAFHLRDVCAPLVKRAFRGNGKRLKEVILECHTALSREIRELKGGVSDAKLKAKRTYLDIMRNLYPSTYNATTFEGTIPIDQLGESRTPVTARMSVSHGGVSIVVAGNGKKIGRRILEFSFINITQWALSKKNNTFEFEVLSARAAAAGQVGKTFRFTFNNSGESEAFDAAWQWYIDAKVLRMKEQASKQRAKQPRRTSIALPMLNLAAREKADGADADTEDTDQGAPAGEIEIDLDDFAVGDDVDIDGDSSSDSDDGPPGLGMGGGESSSQKPQVVVTWEAHTDGEGKVFFKNLETNLTSWDPPPHMVREGWVIKIDPATERQYYMNEETKKTTWVAPLDPRLPIIGAHDEIQL